jgi:hypothetical protein
MIEHASITVNITHTYHVMLSCEIITALGGPVVPLVYINVQQLPGSWALILSSTVLSDTSYSHSSRVVAHAHMNVAVKDYELAYIHNLSTANSLLQCCV